MSVIILHQKVKTARKSYYCAASEWITNYGRLSEFADDYKLTFAEKRQLVELRNDKFKILPGMKYLEQVGIQDGDFFCIQCRIEAVELGIKYDLYQD